MPAEYPECALVPWTLQERLRRKRKPAYPQAQLRVPQQRAKQAGLRISQRGIVLSLPSLMRANRHVLSGIE